jgi:hypothetical protein
LPSTKNGYHLEQAVLYRAEVGLGDDAELTGAARRRLTDAGQRAARRQDYLAAGGLLERAAGLVLASEVDIALESELGEVLSWTGRADEAVRRAEALAERAAAAGDRLGELCGRIQAGRFRLDLVPDDSPEAFAALVEQALPVFKAARDDLALYVGYSALAHVSGAWAHRRRARGIRAGIGARRARRLRAVLAARNARMESLRGHHARLGAARVARRARSTRRTRPVLPRLQGLVVGKARSLRRGP